MAEAGEETPAKEGSLRWIARQLLIRAGTETAAAKEVADRLDGKPSQAIQHSGSVADFDLTKLSDEELERLEIILRAASATAGAEDPLNG
ncbi:hypothetical protein [Bradyrhizobium sp. STM 3561]|uniref:hypothetical protein n=1 Tax=Bradyrhizobium sp. STM 3561 TaxID=578923 RepID=UPI00388EE70F